jgi:ABC-type nitrate/sulfonate/bicarbonate transport system permease component
MSQLASAVPRRYRRPEVLTGVLVVGGLLLLEALAQFELVSPILLRAPTAVFGELLASAGSESIRADVFVTAQRVAVAFLISLVVGSVMSVVLWQVEILRRAYLPLLGAIFGTPLVLLYLVFVVIFGRGSTAIVAISIPLGVIPIVINATDALANVEDVYIDTARSFNASSAQMLWKVIIPDAAPDIFAGVRIGFTYVVISVTAVEFLLVIGQGLGGFISDAYFRFKTTEMFVGIVLIVLLVIVAIFILRRLEEVVQR